MNNVLMRKIVIAAGYQPLADRPTVASVEISCPPGNAGPAYFKGDDGTDIPWQPGEWHEFHHIDLATVQVKGTPGDTVIVVGGTW